MRDRASGVHPDILEHLPPQKNRSLPTVLLYALTCDFTGGCPPPPSRSLCQRVIRKRQFFHNSVGKESACNAEDPSAIPVLGRSLGEGNGNPLKHSCLQNPMGRGAWQATVLGVARVRPNLPTQPTNQQLIQKSQDQIILIYLKN